MISVLINSTSRYPLDRRLLKNRVREWVQARGLTDVEISFFFVGQRKSQALNQMYRQLDEAASVLAFPLNEPRGGDGVLRLGDVMICYPLARQQAVVEKKMVKEVIWELAEHGLTNLLNA